VNCAWTACAPGASAEAARGQVAVAPTTDVGGQATAPSTRNVISPCTGSPASWRRTVALSTIGSPAAAGSAEVDSSVAVASAPTLWVRAPELGEKRGLAPPAGT
jgi:hypothetical protein